MDINDLELIFVDDCSTDNGATWEYLTEFERAYPDSVAIIGLEENLRQGGARNVALQYATGEYIAFVDADDYVEPQFCETLYNIAKKYDADIVQCSHKLYLEKVNTVISNPAKMKTETIFINSDDDRKKMLMSEKLTYGCWNKLYRRNLVIESGVGYGEHCIYEEPLFVYPLLYFGSRFAIISDELYIYRQNPNGTMQNDMKAYNTMFDHTNVQRKVWEFMQNTEFFDRFYEEIKAYFLHTYLYEILDFSKKRDMYIKYEDYMKLVDYVKANVSDYMEGKYKSIMPLQAKLYELIYNGLTEEKYKEFVALV